MYAHMFQERILPSDVDQPREADLGDHGSELAARSRHTVCCRTVASGENLSGDDERRRVRAEVLEEVGEAVEEDESGFSLRCCLHRVVSEALFTQRVSDKIKGDV